MILSEYINLKSFEAQAAAEKARTDQLLRNLYGVLEDFKPGSIKGGHLELTIRASFMLLLLVECSDSRTFG